VRTIAPAPARPGERVRRGDYGHSTRHAQKPSHMHIVALHTVWHNYIRQHKLSPAMAAGLSDWPWSIDDLAAMVDAAALKPGQRGPYKKRIAA
jgi:hypothetical protein